MLRTRRLRAALGAPRWPDQASQPPLEQPQALRGAELTSEAPYKECTQELRSYH